MINFIGCVDNHKMKALPESIKEVTLKSYITILVDNPAMLRDFKIFFKILLCFSYNIVVFLGLVIFCFNWNKHKKSHKYKK
jgi:ABC-type glycerol-3-phosphate transport system permease component